MRIKSKLFTPEQVEWILENYKGLYSSELAEKFNNHFKTNFTPMQFNSFRTNHGLHSGLTGYFPKGHVPANKGKKWDEFMSKEGQARSRTTAFKKGQKPINWRPVGSTRINVDGYKEVKVKEPRTWKLAHRVLWEKHYGPIPKDHRIIFLNQDKTDIRIENLKAVSKADTAVMSKEELFTNDSELTELGIVIAQIKRSATKRKKELKDE